MENSQDIISVIIRNLIKISCPQKGCALQDINPSIYGSFELNVSPQCKVDNSVQSGYRKTTGKTLMYALKGKNSTKVLIAYHFSNLTGKLWIIVFTIQYPRIRDIREIEGKVLKDNDGN